MMDKNNKKGFTLIELIVVIAIIAALSVSLGVSSVQTLKETRHKNYRDSYSEIFGAAKLYAKLKKPVINCAQTGSSLTLCPTDCETNSSGCSVAICCLIESGLLDESYLSTYDPLSEEDNFLYDRHVMVYYDNNELKAKISVNSVCAGSGFITEDNLDSYDQFEIDCVPESGY